MLALLNDLMVVFGTFVLLRTALDGGPPHVEYSLTPLGREAAEKVRLLADWIELNLPRIRPEAQ